MKKFTFFIIMLLLSLTDYGIAGRSDSIKNIKSQGKDIGKRESSKALKLAKEFSVENITPESLKGQTFNPKEALGNIKEGNKPESASYDFLTDVKVMKNQEKNKNFHSEELFLKKSELISQGQIQEEEIIEHSIEKCNQSANPALISFTRTLNINVEEKNKAKICLGHESHDYHSSWHNSKDSASIFRNNFSNDPTIKTFEVEIIPLHHHEYKYDVRVKWTHDNDTSMCDHYEFEKSYEESGENWVYDDQTLFELSKSPDCTFIEQKCLDSTTTKIINGIEISRPCWKEQLIFLYKFPEIKECEFLISKNCEQIKQDCIRSSSLGCAVWEHSFKCFSKVKRKNATGYDEFFGLAKNEWETEYAPNKSFAEVTSKLAVFQELKKELELAQTVDASNLQIFNGKKMECKKSVTENLMYDCCFNNSGLAKQIGLSKCDADEISLAEMCENGLCHYVGSYAEQFAGLWKSSDAHVYCCYPSKLARIIIEEGREQLGIQWGKPKHPNCKGFSIGELTKLNFSQMDISEAFDVKTKNLPDHFQKKIDDFQNRLKEEIKIKEEQV